MQVISHDGEVVHVAAQRFQVVVPVVLLRRRNGGGEQQAGAHGIKLPAEFRSHGIEILCVFGTARNHAAVYRIFPVDIDAVKDSRRMNTIGEVAFDEDVHTGLDESPNIRRLGCVGESFRVRPSSQ